MRRRRPGGARVSVSKQICLAGHRGCIPGRRDNGKQIEMRASPPSPGWQATGKCHRCSWNRAPGHPDEYQKGRDLSLKDESFRDRRRFKSQPTARRSLFSTWSNFFSSIRSHARAFSGLFSKRRQTNEQLIVSPFVHAVKFILLEEAESEQFVVRSKLFRPSLSICAGGSRTQMFRTRYL